VTTSPQDEPLPLLALHERARYRAAADYALRRYPGPVGELIHRELSAYAEFGHRFARDALIPDLARNVLTPPAHPVDGAQVGPRADTDEDEAERPGAA
jgi:hypothetical protein